MITDDDGEVSNVISEGGDVVRISWKTNHKRMKSLEITVIYSSEIEGEAGISSSNKLQGGILGREGDVAGICKEVSE